MQRILGFATFSSKIGRQGCDGNFRESSLGRRLFFSSIYFDVDRERERLLSSASQRGGLPLGAASGESLSKYTSSWVK